MVRLPWRSLQRIDIGFNDFADGVKGRLVFVFRYLEDCAFRKIENAVQVSAIFVAMPHDFVGFGDQPAQRRFVANNTGIVLDIDGGWNRIDDTGQVGGTADLFELVFIPQYIGQGDQVHRFGLGEQFGDGPKMTWWAVR